MKTKDQIALQEVVTKSITISGAEAVIRCLLAEGIDLIWLPWWSYYARLR